MRDDLAAVLKKNIHFMQDEIKSGVLLHVTGINLRPLPEVKALEQWNFPDDWQAYMDACIERETAYWEQRRGIDDDRLPTMKPFYGIAEHSAFVGGEVVYGGNTSYHMHPVKDWSDLDTLVCDENNENFKMLIDSIRYLKKRSGEVGFLASLRGLDAPMDLANAIRGNDLFTDFYDEEENVRKLLEFCTKAGRWTTEHQFEAVGQAEEGTITGLGIWIPGHGIGHLSEDTSSMCSMEMYREFGEPYTRKLLMDYDSALFHMHAMGRHILPAIAAMDKVKVIEISCDPNQPAPIEVYKEYADVLENKTVFIKMTRQQIEDNLNFLAARKTIIEYQAYTKEDADYICDILAPLRDFT